MVQRSKSLNTAAVFTRHHRPLSHQSSTAQNAAAASFDHTTTHPSRSAPARERCGSSGLRSVHLDSMRMPQLMRTKPAPDPSLNREVAQLRRHRGGAPRAATGWPIDHAEQRSRRQSGALLRPIGQDGPRPRVHPHLATAITLPMPYQQAAPALVQIGLGERKGLVDPNARTPQHNDQTTHPPAVSGVSGLAHNRDALVDCGRICRLPAAFVRWDPAGVIAGHCRRGPGTAGGVQQLMSKHGSLLGRADRFDAALTDPGQSRALDINRDCRVG